MTDPVADAIAQAQARQAAIDRLWDFDDPAGSQARFETAADASHGVERDVLLTQVARALGLAGRYDEAKAVLDSVGGQATVELRVRVLLERGRVANSADDPSGARPLFEAAFEAATETGMEFLAIDALHMRAIVASSEEQAALNRRALDLATSATDPRARQWRASLLNNIGWGAFDRGDLIAALALFEEAVSERQAQGKQSELLVARWCVARVLRELGRSEEALAIQRELAQAHTAAGTSDPYVDEEIAALGTSATLTAGNDR